MESDDFTRHYIIRYLSACELVLPPLVCGKKALVLCPDLSLRKGLVSQTGLAEVLKPCNC